MTEVAEIWEDVAGHRLISWSVALRASPVITALGYVAWVLTVVSETPSVGSDPATFLLGGQLLAEGGAPYVHLWDPKPPAIHETTALISVLAGGDAYATYLGGVAVTGLVAVATVALVVAHVSRAGATSVTAALAGFTVIAYRPFLAATSHGPFVKYYATCALVGALLALDVEYYLLAGVAGALAVLYWQFAAPVPLVVAGLVGWRYINGETSLREVGRCVGGAGATTLVVLAPIVWHGGLAAMINQVVVAPALWTYKLIPKSPVVLFSQFGNASPLLGLATVGMLVLVWGAVRDPRRRPTVTVYLFLFGWYTLYAARSAQTGIPDLFPLTALVGLIIGKSVVQLREWPAALAPTSRRVLQVATGAVAFAAIGALLGNPLWVWPQSEFGMQFLAGDLGGGCHVRGSSMEQYWVRTIPDAGAGETCLQQLRGLGVILE